MYKKLNLLVFILFILILNITAAGNDYKIVTEEYPPFNYTENGEVKGISADIVKEILKNIGWNNVKIEVLPWLIATRLTEHDPKTIIFSITRIPERENKYKWVGPIATDYSNIYSLSNIDGKNVPYDIKSLKDAMQYSITTQQGGAFAQYLIDKGFTHIQYTKNVKESLLRLLNCQAQLLADSEFTLYAVMNQLGINSSRIRCIMKVQTVELYIGFNKEADNSVVNKFQTALNKIKQNGDFDKISNKYYEKFLSLKK